MFGRMTKHHIVLSEPNAHIVMTKLFLFVEQRSSTRFRAVRLRDNLRLRSRLIVNCLALDEERL
jgi:hypothetical protein